MPAAHDTMGDLLTSNRVGVDLSCGTIPRSQYFVAAAVLYKQYVALYTKPVRAFG